MRKGCGEGLAPMMVGRRRRQCCGACGSVEKKESESTFDKKEAK